MEQFIIDDTKNYFYSLLMKKYQLYLQNKGVKVWLDASYYVNFSVWIKNNYNVRIDTLGRLTFSSEHDHTMFLIRIL